MRSEFSVVASCDECHEMEKSFKCADRSCWSSMRRTE